MVKIRYDEGDLVTAGKTTRGLRPGSLTETKPQKPSGHSEWNVPVARKETLLVVRHEAGGGTHKFKGSVLVLSKDGFLWVDSRDVVFSR